MRAPTPPSRQAPEHRRGGARGPAKSVQGRRRRLKLCRCVCELWVLCALLATTYFSSSPPHALSATVNVHVLLEPACSGTRCVLRPEVPARLRGLVTLGTLLRVQPGPPLGAVATEGQSADRATLRLLERQAVHAHPATSGRPRLVPSGPRHVGDVHETFALVLDEKEASLHCDRRVRQRHCGPGQQVAVCLHERKARRLQVLLAPPLFVPFDAVAAAAFDPQGALISPLRLQHAETDGERRAPLLRRERPKYQ
jgi:hypothetical protein